MTVQEFYQQLINKGYSNAEIEDSKAEFANSGMATDALDTHIICCLELDRLQVFKVWYGVAWQSSFDSSYTDYWNGKIDYQVEYIMDNN